MFSGQSDLPLKHANLPWCFSNVQVFPNDICTDKNVFFKITAGILKSEMSHQDKICPPTENRNAFYAAIITNKCLDASVRGLFSILGVSGLFYFLPLFLFFFLGVPWFKAKIIVQAPIRCYLWHLIRFCTACLKATMEEVTHKDTREGWICIQQFKAPL